MKKNNTKAIFYAYSNNALDHLAPYVILCKKKFFDCTVIFGEDFIKHKVSPKKNILKIFKDNKIHLYYIPKHELNEFKQIIFYCSWFIANLFGHNDFLPKYFQFKIKGLCARLFKYIDGKTLGKNTALKLIKDNKNYLVFIDSWNKNKIIQSSFLSAIKNKVKIISTGHFVWHFPDKIKNMKLSYQEDISFMNNRWEAMSKKHIKQKIVTGSLRFSKTWLGYLDKYHKKKYLKKNYKLRVTVLTHTKKYTSSWKKMFNLLNVLSEREDINLRIIPHIRGMSNLIPPKNLENCWDNKSSLDIAIKNSDLVLFWESSAIFEAVVREKKILFLSFLSTRKQNYFWQKKNQKDLIVKNEIELIKILNNYSKNNKVNNSTFKKVIWPKGDPWKNVSNYMDSLK